MTQFLNNIYKLARKYSISENETICEIQGTLPLILFTDHLHNCLQQKSVYDCCTTYDTKKLCQFAKVKYVLSHLEADYMFLKPGRITNSQCKAELCDKQV